MKLLLSLALFLPSVAFADCPTSFANGYGPGGSYDYTHSGPIWSQGIYGGSVAHDLIVGTFGASGGGGGGKQSGGVALNFSDVYQIVGPASGSPISFNVIIHLSGNLSTSLYYYPYIGDYCNAATASLQVTSGPSSVSYEVGSYSQACTPVTVDHDLSLALQKLPSEPFTTGFNLGVFGSAGGSVNGTIAFAGLPPGYTVTSCHGYSSPPTPTAPTSWGRVKAGYR